MFTVTIDTDNAAFDSTSGKQREIARILKEIAGLVRAGEDSGKVRDANGNTVGSWEITA